MSNQKVKTEQYANLGGINSKYSPYITGPLEFLDIQNLDFQTPGSLSERWGSTMYFGQTFPGQVNSIHEVSFLSGSSFVVSSYSGGIYYGATTGQNQGMSLMLQSATYQAWSYPIGVFGSTAVGGYFDPNISLGYEGDGTEIVTANVALSTEYFVVSPIVQSDNTLSFASLNNYLFAADGNKFFKFDGVTTTPIGLPPALQASSSSHLQSAGTPGYFGSTFFAHDGSSFLITSARGHYAVYMSYTNSRGFEGPIWPVAAINNERIGASLVGDGGSFYSLVIPIATPLMYGISAINTYIYSAGPSTRVGKGGPTSNFGVDLNFWSNYGYVKTAVTPASGSTFTNISVGSSVGGISLMEANAFPLPDSIFQAYKPIGITAFIGLSLTLASNPGYTQQFTWNRALPRYLENYQNRLFLAGFSGTPSTVWFSDLAEPEGYQPDFNFEVRTNDGDFITAMKSYSTRLYLWKQNSFHALSGDNPNNFFLQELSNQYGCINNRCAIVYDDILVFLDRKGVMMWNGAQLTVLSNKIQPLIDTMQYNAALTAACMVHDKLRNQVLIAIPVNGSTTNNITLVYDYLAGAWTTQKGYTPSAFAQIQGRNNTKNAFYGDLQGRVNWFGASFLSDNGAGFTCTLKTRFLHEMGDSTQKMFRRLFLNTDSPAGGTLVFGINMYQDYGSSVVLGTTIVLSDFQNRIDFGVSGKSLAFELTNIQTSIKLRIHGFTVESRFLRRV